MKERMQETRKSSPGRHEPCIHVAGKDVRVPKICLRNRECWHCAFDQWIEAMDEQVMDVDRLSEERRILRRAA